MDPVALIARIVVAGGFAGARPLLTLFVLQLYVALFETPDLPAGFDWLIHEYAIGAMGVLAIVEHFVRTDPDIDELLQWPSAAVGAGAAMVSAVLLASISGEVMPATEPTLAALPSLGVIAVSEMSLGMSVLGAALGVVVSLGALWVRRQIMDALNATSFSSRFTRWGETGVVIGAVVGILALPGAAVVLAILMVVGMAVAAFVVRAFEKAADEQSRRQCECGYLARNEATICPECKTSLEPATKLGQKKTKQLPA